MNLEKIRDNIKYLIDTCENEIEECDIDKIPSMVILKWNLVTVYDQIDKIISKGDENE